MKKVLLVLLVVVLTIGSVAGTLAFFAGKAVTHNVITSANVDIALVETQKDGDKEIPYPTDPVAGIMPGREVSKIVRVENTGKADAWVRIKLDTAVTDAQGEALPATELQMDIDTENWVLEDGYYYYKTILKPGEKTKPLFTTVLFKTTMGNDYQSSRVNIDVLAYATQSDNNPIPAGGTAADVKGWPAI